MSIELVAKQAKLIGIDDRTRFKELVLKDDQVMRNGLTERIANAHFLALLSQIGELVGTNAVKNNRPHQRTIEEDSGVKLPDEEFLGEVGWLHVAQAYRGGNLGSLLLSAILSCEPEKRLFATVQSKNIGARHLHERHGFHHVGRPWPSGRRDDMVYLYVHNGRRR